MSERLRGVSGLTVFPSKANFLFVELQPSVSGKHLRDRLLVKHGIMVRECSNKTGSSEQYLRLAVQTNAAVDVLAAALCEEL
jgi:histidinol-phosphate/aromatic aminotransferase/cobyric acid decarboxylase-like protein